MKTIVLTRVVQTCKATPSQWDAWDAQEQYFYLHYRSGCGTVYTYPNNDWEQWDNRAPIIQFEHGGQDDGEIDLDEFLKLAGMQFAPAEQRQFCAETTSSCTCVLQPAHTDPHQCECGGSWYYDDEGVFQVVSFPLLPYEDKPVRVDPPFFGGALKFYNGITADEAEKLKKVFLAAVEKWTGIPMIQPPQPRIERRTCFQHENGTWIHLGKPHTCPKYLKVGR